MEYRKKYSVIIPVYNAEIYLDKCIQSILDQTYKNFELLLVDDGSKDGSGAICDRYASFDSRVKVFHNSNGGASAARNFGMEKAEGEYIAFIDADDYVSLDYLEMFARYDYDCIFCGIEHFGGTNSKEIPIQGHLNDKREIIKFIEDAIGTGYMRGPCAKAIRRDIIVNNHIKFNNKVIFGEDVLFCLEVYSHCRSTQALSSVGYYYKMDNSVYDKYVVEGKEYLSFLKALHNICAKRDMSELFKEGFSSLVASEKYIYMLTYYKVGFVKSIRESVYYIINRIYRYEDHASTTSKIKACANIITLPYKRAVYLMLRRCKLINYK